MNVSCDTAEVHDTVFNHLSILLLLSGTNTLWRSSFFSNLLWKQSVLKVVPYEIGEACWGVCATAYLVQMTKKWPRLKIDCWETSSKQHRVIRNLQCYGYFIIYNGFYDLALMSLKALACTLTKESHGQCLQMNWIVKRKSDVRQPKNLKWWGIEPQSYYIQPL